VTAPGRRTLWASSLIGRRVETADGRSLGRIVDLAFTPGDGRRIDCMFIGRSTFLGRFSVLRSSAHPILGLGAAQDLPWSAVEQVLDDRVVVRAEEASR
jgi:sporulation protein YlmC with PRC-barrel domain